MSAGEIRALNDIVRRHLPNRGSNMAYKAAKHAPPPGKLHQGDKQTETKRMRKPTPYKKGMKGKTDS